MGHLRSAAHILIAVGHSPGKKIVVLQQNTLFLVKLNPKFSSQVLEEGKAT